MSKLLLTCGVLLAVLSGCHTISGVGQDVSAGGQHIENAADKY